MLRLNWVISLSLVWTGLVILIGASLVIQTEAQRSMGTSYQAATRPRSRSIRGFKQAALSTARGFGKRASQLFGVDLSNSYPLKINNRDSFPVEWFIEGMQSKPALARFLVQRLVDLNRGREQQPPSSTGVESPLLLPTPPLNYPLSLPLPLQLPIHQIHRSSNHKEEDQQQQQQQSQTDEDVRDEEMRERSERQRERERETENAIESDEADPSLQSSKFLRLNAPPPHPSSFSSSASFQPLIPRSLLQSDKTYVQQFAL